MIIRPERNRCLLSLAVLLVFFLHARSGSAEEISQAQLRQRYAQNIREGFAAKSGFELITTESVPRHNIGRSRLEKDSSEWQQFTYPLHPHPHVYAYRESGDRLKHIQWVTLSWNQAREKSPFVFDLYLHGASDADDDLALHVPNLDIRKFLHQSISRLSKNQANQDLIRLQAYFAEFSRKAKILSPLAISSPGQRERLYDNRRLSDLQLGIVHAIQDFLGVHEDIVQPLNQALLALEAKGALNLDIVHRNLQKAIEAHKKHEIFMEEELGNKASLGDLTDKVMDLIAAQRISSLKIINNCREPGIYEIEIRDGLSRPLLRATFNFHYEWYNQILSQFHGFGIRAQGTGFRISSEVRNLDFGLYWNSLLPWKWLKSFPKVNVNALSAIQPIVAKEGVEVAAMQGEIEAIRGRIPYEDYEEEVRKKSEYHFKGPEPLTYVRINPSLPLPTGFESPDHIPATRYWTSEENASKVVPHHFRSYEDIQGYDILLSEFDLNGIYLGQSELRDFEKEGKDGRWEFDFKYLQDLDTFEIRQGADYFTEIRLKSQSSDRSAMNFIFGNFSIEVGESVDFLFGIGTQPLITSYNQNVYQDQLLYGFAYDSNGIILDHHDQRIGVEQVHIERIDPHVYRVRLISYERILPLWEGILRVNHPV